MTACLVFIDEISRTRQLKSSWSEAPVVEDSLLDSYRSGLKAMSLFSQESNLMREFAAILIPSISNSFHFSRISTHQGSRSFRSDLTAALTLLDTWTTHSSRTLLHFPSFAYTSPIYPILIEFPNHIIPRIIPSL